MEINSTHPEYSASAVDEVAKKPFISLWRTWECLTELVLKEGTDGTEGTNAESKRMRSRGLERDLIHGKAGAR